MKRSLVLISLAVCCALTAITVPGGAQDKAPLRVAILPFTMHTPNDLAYLQSGIRDMLASRLAWQGKVQIVERGQTEQATRSVKSDLTLPEAIRIGNSLRADHVLFGSVTAIGQAVSIDAKMAPTSGGGEPVALFAQTQSLDEVIPRVNQFAQELNAKVFSRPPDQAMAQMSESQAASTRNPELLLPDAMQGGDRISYLNPNFIEVNPEGSLRQPGLWRSQTFREGIIGMDLGDVDGDGRLEMVAVSRKKITVYRREAYGLKAIGSYTGSRVDNFFWVTMVDTDRDKSDEIYVTNLRQKNQPQGNTTDRVGYGRDSSRDPSALVFRYTGGALQLVADSQPYFLNSYNVKGRGKVLIGQRLSPEGDLKSDVMEMQLHGKSLAAVGPAALPAKCNVFNFARGDINNDGADETVLIDDENRLFVLSSSGNTIWKSRQRFGATSNYILGKTHDLRYNQIDYYYLPSNVVLTDLNKDNVLEVVVNRSPDYSRFMPEGFKSYESGEVVSLSWDQMGLAENWKTREISGMVTALRVGDFNHDGTPELVVALISAKDFMKLWESQSTIFTYDLNISTKTAQVKKE